MERIMPEYNAWKVFYERTKQAAYQTDSTKGTTPIYQEIPNLSAAKSAYGNIVYNKAPAFLRQAEFYLGEKEFQTAVRSFLKKHEFKNATWQALVSEFELAGKQDLKSWASAWVTKRGLPIVRVKNGDLRRYRHVPEKNNAMMHDTAEVYWYEQADALGQNGIWPFKVKPLLRNGSYDKVKDVTVTEARSNHFESYWVMIVNSPNRTVKTPEFVFPNYGDYGYGIFLLDPKSRAYVLKNIQNEKDDFLRAMMWGSLWDSVREAELDPKEYVELAIKNIHIETDVTTIQTVLGRVSTAMNYYLSDKDANTFAPRLEELLLARIKNSETLGERITYYRALLNNARGEEAVSFLKKLVRGDVFIGKPNSSIEASESQVIIVGTHLPALRTKDKFDIVTRLAILGDPDALKLLDELKSKETSDDAKRYAYAIGAGFGTKEAKEKYFNDFVNNKEISESWIEDAFRPFNSALHSELTLQYLERALKELPNHKRNRKIFFVNGWLGAFIGGQRSEEALAIVNKFLADNPNLDKDLRLKILENADVIERAVKIRRTFGVD
jgi:aminopeptidase N